MKEGTKEDLNVIDNEKVMTINVVITLVVLNQLVEVVLIGLSVKLILATG
ncbi:hypothetical protein [Cognaticolwellia mytili]|nr:hypothetical protein [Cognaticolwellia mytili]